MGLRVTAAQAAWLVDRQERQVRWRIKERKDLPAIKDGKSWAIDVDDLARIPGWRINRERLAELQAADAMTAASMAARLAELERSVRELRGRLARLEAQSGLSSTIASDGAHTATPDDRQTALSGIGGIGTPTRPDSPLSAFGDILPDIGVSRATERPYAPYQPYQTRRAVPTMRLNSTLPDGLVSVASFAELHGIPAQTWRGAIASGRLRASVGSWKQGRALVKHALDADGRAAFFALWGDREDFQRCAECPH